MSRKIDMNIADMSNIIANSIIFKKHLVYEESFV